MNNSLKITDLPENERPCERLLRYGAESLSNSELLAVILRKGISKKNVLELSCEILKQSGGLNGLLNLAPEEFMSLTGVGKVKAAQLLAIAEISKRFKSYKSGQAIKISQPQDAVDIVMEDMRYLKKEYLKVILLNIKNIVMFVKDISIGSINSSIVHPREVFYEAVRRSCASIIICHNHPSGDPTPSSEDINVTHRLKECGKLLGIDLLDHIIIGDGRYVSLREKDTL